MEQMHVLYLAEDLRSHPGHPTAREELDSLKRRFLELAKSAGFAD